MLQPCSAQSAPCTELLTQLAFSAPATCAAGPAQLGDTPCTCCPESVPTTCQLCRFDCIHVSASVWLGCAQDTCRLSPLGATSNADRFLQELQALRPSTTPSAHEWQQFNSTTSSKAFDLGSLVAAVQPLQQAPSSATQPLHGGVLTPFSSHNSSSSSSSNGSNTRGSEQQQLPLRVVLVYCRSRLPAPVWQTHRQAGLAVDCLHVHDKPQPGEQQQQLQVRPS
jgi:hypothetical protein